MDDIATLGMRIDSLEAERAAQRLDGMTRAGARAESQGMKLTTMYKAVAAAAALAGTAIYKILSKTSEFQVLQANLVTATGSIEGASKAFSALKQLAKETPFSLQEVTESFTKLVNYGLTPSTRAIKSYGDTAAAFGKPIISLVEGVADAVNGEFERVKESFNVKAKNLGDTVELRFRGVTTTVKNNAAEIEEYFIKLGEKNFLGGMDRQMNTLKGSVSNLGDAWDVMLNSLGEGRMSDLAKNGLGQISEVLAEITRWAESGQLNTAIDIGTTALKSQQAQALSLGQTLATVLVDGATLIGTFVSQAEPGSDEWEKYWTDVFTNFPSNIEYMIKLSQIHLGGFVEKAGVFAAEFKATWASIAADVNDEWEANKAWLKGGKTLEEARFERRNLRSDAARDAAFAAGYSPLAGGAPADTDETIDERVKREIDALNEQNDALRKNTAEHVDRAAELRELYNSQGQYVGDDTSLLPPLDGPGSIDPLAGFKVPGDGSTSNGKEKIPKAKKVAEMRSAAEAEADFQDQLSKSIYEREAMNELEALNASEQRITESYERRKAEILAITNLTEEQKLRLMQKADSEYAAAQEDFMRKRNEAQLKLASDFFGNLSTIAGAAGKKGHRLAQGAAIAQATMDTYAAATAAYKSMVGIPYVGPALALAASGAAVAMGFMNIQKIKSTEYAGAYTDGGIVPGGSFSGDKLTARVNSSEMILNGGQQKKLFDMANGKNNAAESSANKWKVVVNNNASGYIAEINEDRENQVIEIAVNRSIERIAAQAGIGGGKVDRALERAYRLKR